MNEKKWFSARIRFVCLAEGTGGVDYMDSIIVFRAEDFSDALERALKRGRAEEKTYLNYEQKRVVWKVKEILTLDQIRSNEIDGAEVYFEVVKLPPGEKIDFDAAFFPEKSKPSQTI
jgi:hypothetical protein